MSLPLGNRLKGVKEVLKTVKNFKKIVSTIVVIAVIGAILVVAGCGKSSSSSSATTVTSTYTVQKGTLVSTVSAVGTVSMPEQTQLTFGTGSSTSSLSTVQEINVAFGDTVKKGDVLAKIDTSALETAVTQAKADLSTAQLNLQQANSDATKLNAQAAVKNAQATLATAERQLQDLQTSQIADAKDAVSDAQLALDNAKQTLAITQTSVANNIIDAENNVADKQTTYNDYVAANISHLDRWDIAAQKDELAWELQKAEDNLDAVKLQGEISLASAQSNVTKAEATLKNAQGDLAEIESDNPDMLKQEAAVATAKANLITAQNNLAYIEAGYNTELLQIKVDNAQTNLDNANAQLEAATMVAPFDGVIAAVNANVGDTVTATEEIIYLVNTSKVEISSSVDETDVAKLAKGQRAVITLDAIEDANLEGTVGAISPVAVSSSNVVTYSFSIEIQDTKGYDLKEGMSASAEIMVLNKTDVLLVPTKAIKQMGDRRIVQVETAEGTIEPRVIQIGDTNGTYTEVTSGLSEGDKVQVQTSTSTPSTETPTGGFMPGGDFGGGELPPGDGGPSFQVGP